MPRLTIGGLEESQALHWTIDTYQRFGRIMFDLMSGAPSDRLCGYNEYFRMRRYFFADEWNSKMDELDKFRRSKRFPLIADMIQQIRSEVIEYKRPLHAEPSSPDLPEFKATVPIDTQKIMNVICMAPEVEQLDLFA